MLIFDLQYAGLVGGTGGGGRRGGGGGVRCLRGTGVVSVYFFLNKILDEYSVEGVTPCNI